MIKSWTENAENRTNLRASYAREAPPTVPQKATPEAPPEASKKLYSDLPFETIAEQSDAISRRLAELDRTNLSYAFDRILKEVCPVDDDIIPIYQDRFLTKRRWEMFIDALKIHRMTLIEECLGIQDAHLLSDEEFMRIIKKEN